MPPKPDCKDDKPARDKMAAITVIANPLLQDQKVILFQSGSPTYGLRVSSRELVSGAFAETVGPEDPTSVGRPIAYPGQLASMLYKDFVTVFGVTGDDADNLQIEMLSPVQTPIDLSDYTVNSGAIASCATGNGKQGWLYLITYGPFTSDPNILRPHPTDFLAELRTEILPLASGKFLPAPQTCVTSTARTLA